MDDRPRKSEVAVLYLVTSYRSPRQLERLIHGLKVADPACGILIHHDRFRSDASGIDLAQWDDVWLHTSDEPINWGDATLEEARWRLMSWALQHCDFRWLVTLSEQDYPLVALGGLAAALDAGGADAYIEAEPVAGIVDARTRWEMTRRYRYRYRLWPRNGTFDRLAPQLEMWRMRAVDAGYYGLNRIQPWVRFYASSRANGFPGRVGVRTRTPQGGQAEPWYGSTWYCLSRDAVVTVVDALRHDPAYVRWARGTVIPVESATLTILGNSPQLQISQSGLHHVRWGDPASGRPDVFTSADLDELAETPYPFARKFDLDVDATVLDQLDARIAATDVTATDATTAPTHGDHDVH